MIGNNCVCVWKY